MDFKKVLEILIEDKEKIRKKAMKKLATDRYDADYEGEGFGDEDIKSDLKKVGLKGIYSQIDLAIKNDDQHKLNQILSNSFDKNYNRTIPTGKYIKQLESKPHLLAIVAQYGKLSNDEIKSIISSTKNKIVNMRKMAEKIKDEKELEKIAFDIDKQRVILDIIKNR